MVSLLWNWHSSGWQSSPDQIRQSTLWDLRVEPSPSWTVQRPFQHAPVTVWHASAHTASGPDPLLHFTYDPRLQSSLPLTHGDPTSPSRIELEDGATFELQAVSLGIAQPSYFTGSDVHLEPAQWVDLNGEAKTFRTGNKEVDHYAYEKDSSFLIPRAKFLIQTTNTPNLTFLEASLYNLQTHAYVSGNSEAQATDPLVISSDLHQWHDAPLLLVIHVAYGEMESRTLPTSTGSTLEFSNFDVQVVHQENTRWSLYSLGGDSTTSTLLFQSPHASGPGSFIGVSFSPQDYAGACSASLSPLGAEAVLHPSFQGITGITLHHDKPTTEVTIRAPRYCRRLALVIPSLPGLATEEMVKHNLFNVAIPYVRAQHAQELADTVEAATGFSVYWNVDDSRVSQEELIELTDTTPRKLIRFLRAKTGGDPPIVVERGDSSDSIGFGRESDWWLERYFSWLF